MNGIGASAAVGHTLENSIPLSIFPVAPDKFCICICGLPGKCLWAVLEGRILLISSVAGRGKTHISRRLGRYLEFFHAIPVLVLHVADYRRKLYGDYHVADWFDPLNEEAAVLREACQNAATSDMVEFLNKHPNGVAILDSTNATFVRRQRLTNQVEQYTTISDVPATELIFI